jgi:hypothetical protein
MMKSVCLALALALAATAPAEAAPTTVGDFRGTVQTVTTTGSATLSLGTDTTIVRFNCASDLVAS